MPVCPVITAGRAISVPWQPVLHYPSYTETDTAGNHAETGPGQNPCRSVESDSGGSGLDTDTGGGGGQSHRLTVPQHGVS